VISQFLYSGLLDAADAYPAPPQADLPHRRMDDLPAPNFPAHHASTHFFQSFRLRSHRTLQSTANKGGNHPNRTTGRSTRGERRKHAKNRQPQSTRRNDPPEPRTSSAPGLMGLPGHHISKISNRAGSSTQGLRRRPLSV
jgi:hypothetical protein